MKKSTVMIALLVLISVLFCACAPTAKDDDSWKTSKLYDLSLPNFAGSGIGENGANSDGWYEVFTDNFDGNALNYGLDKYNLPNDELWTTSPHARRWKTLVEGKDNYTSYWCPDMVKVENGNCVISSIETTSHVCTLGICPQVGRFSGGIETRRLVNPDDNKGNSDELLFSQSFGYYEARVQMPKTNGLWSAFWLQSSNMRKVGNNGLDGTEVDIFESAFINHNKDGKSSKMGHALLWDGYGVSCRVDDYILNVNNDLYEGYHTFALKWTPLYYVFYIDGQPTWATMGGGVSKVKEFLRLTVEMDDGNGSGPHGMNIGKYSNATTKPFMIDYVKVYQNTKYLPYAIADENFDGVFDPAN